MCLDYLPEGSRQADPENAAVCSDPARLEKAAARRTILEARAVSCTAAHDLILDLGGIRGIIPREEGAIGIREGTLRDIALIARTGKPVVFCVDHLEEDSSGRPEVICSRRAAQLRCREEYLDLLRPGDILPARVTHLEPFGCFADIGCGIHALLPIDAISVSRISHPKDRLKVQQDIYTVLRQRDEKGRFLLTMKELLGSWAENAERFSVGDTVCGTVRSVEDYGIFIELAPNLSGLAERKKEARPGMQATVYIKNIIPEKMKIKLAVVDLFEDERPLPPLPYTRTGGHIARFVYSPPCCDRRVETVFL